MTGFNHGMTGAVIALAVKQPVLAVPLAFASHYLTDLVPHYGAPLKDVLGRKFNLFHTFDFFFAIFLMAVLALMFPADMWRIWACMIVAALPDGVFWFYRKSVKEWPKGLDRFTTWHFKINAGSHGSHRQHLYYDGLWFIACWLIVLFFYFQ